MDTEFWGPDDGAWRSKTLNYQIERQLGWMIFSIRELELRAVMNRVRTNSHSFEQFIVNIYYEFKKSFELWLLELMEVKDLIFENFRSVEYFIENIYYEFKRSLHPSLEFKHLQKIIITSAQLGIFRDGLHQISDEIILRDVGKNKYRIELKKSSRGVWVDVENISFLTAKENESDDISANRREALDGARLSRNTSAVSIFQENGFDIEANRGNAWEGSAQNYRKVPLCEWIFVVSNLTVELPSAAFDQLSSPHKPLYALMAMTLSLPAFLLCVTELVYRGVKEGITFKCRSGIPWFYYPYRSQNHKRFGNFADIIGLVCAISQCIVTAINYDFARRAANSPIKFSLLPIIFALGLLCSRILETVEKKASERQDR